MLTTQLLLFLAVLAQVGLTAFIYTALLRARFAAVGAGGLDMRRISYDSAAWPERPRLIANSLTSQFELPVLFYVAVLFAILIGAADWISVVLAWLFVILRIVHAAIHTGPNAVMPRLQVFLLGFAILVLFWTYLTFHAVTGWLLVA